MTKMESTPSGAVRVRFAPSPTGDLHVGGVRTALFNYLFAKHTGGKFLLRVEDTDQKRSTPEAIQVILEGMQWLGLNNDEDIVYQSTRIDRHKAAALKLLETGAAYRAFETAEELAQARKDAEARGEYYSYNRAGLRLSEQEIAERVRRGDPFSIRIKVPDDFIVFDDAVHGEMRVHGKEIDDFIVMRSDGTPTYMLAVVVDDIDMGVTHVLRADDHLSNTPKQILIYQGLGAKVPQFGHLPLILGADKSKLSKRHGTTSILGYRDKGYLPETMINYLGLLGWSPGDDRNVIGRDELIGSFSFSGLTASPSVFDEPKLEWLNCQYINNSSFRSVAEHVLWHARRAVESGILTSIPSEEYLEKIWPLVNSRLHFIGDLFTETLYLFTDPQDYDLKGVKKSFPAEMSQKLEQIASDLTTTSMWDTPSIEEIVRKRAEEWDVGAGKLIHPLRLAVSGVTGGPGLFEMMEVLGKETVLRRIAAAINYINKIIRN